MLPNLTSFVHGFLHDGSVTSQAGPSSLRLWDREAMILFGSAQQAHIQSRYRVPESTLVELVQQIRLMQDLEDMGESAATGISYREILRPGRVERD